MYTAYRPSVDKGKVAGKIFSTIAQNSYDHTGLPIYLIYVGLQYIVHIHGNTVWQSWHVKGALTV